TIAGLSEYIGGAQESAYTAIEQVVKKEYYEASSAQKRVWLLGQIDPESTGYNMPGVLVVDGDLDIGRLEKAFEELIAGHETLRTSFGTVGDEIVQRIAEEVDFEIQYRESAEEDIKETISKFIRPFDLSKAPLLRVGLVKVAENRHYLLFDMHHIISDGASMAILTKEFMSLYEGHKLKKQRLQYKDYSEWQNEFL
ncbi:MAG: condensation domain-containing protein, partial [Bacillota bacterium]